MENPDINDSNNFDGQQPPLFWQIRQEENARDAKMVKIIVAVAIVVVIGGFAWVMFAMTHLVKQEDPRWIEAKMAVESIKQAVDTYKAKTGGDISGLDSPPGTLREGFIFGSTLLSKLKLDAVQFENLMHFDAEDFSLEFVTDGTDGEYIITVNAANGRGGSSLVGPKDGVESYNSSTNEWSEKFKDLPAQPLSQLPGYVSPPTIPPPPLVTDSFDPIAEIEKMNSKYDMSYRIQGGVSVWGVVREIVSCVEKYAAQNRGDISGLDDPEGTLEKGFVSDSPLIEKLKFDISMIDDNEYLDPEDFTIEFITDGKDGLYKVKVDTSKGKNDATYEPSRVKAEYNSLTGTYESGLGD